MSSSKTVKWSCDNIITFLETYVNFELLWNVRHGDYTNKMKRESAMASLKAELVCLGLTVPDLGFLRARVKAIKSTYRSELLKINESKNSGAGADDVYVPKLPWFSIADTFMRGVVVTRKSSSNLDSPGVSTNTANEEELGESEQNIDIIEERSPEATPLPQVEPPTPAPNPKRKRLSKLSKVEGAIEKLKKIAESRQPVGSNKTPLDEVELFGKYVAAQLRDLPMVNRLTCQDKIQSMLTKERLKILQAPRATPSPMLSGSSIFDAELDDDNTQLTTDGEFFFRKL